MRKKAVEMTKTWNKDLEVGATLEGEYIKKEFMTVTTAKQKSM